MDCYYRRMGLFRTTTTLLHVSSILLLCWFTGEWTLESDTQYEPSSIFLFHFFFIFSFFRRTTASRQKFFTGEYTLQMNTTSSWCRRLRKRNPSVGSPTAVKWVCLCSCARASRVTEWETRSVRGKSCKIWTHRYRDTTRMYTHTHTHTNANYCCSSGGIPCDPLPCFFFFFFFSGKLLFQYSLSVAYLALRCQYFSFLFFSQTIVLVHSLSVHTQHTLRSAAIFFSRGPWNAH